MKKFVALYGGSFNLSTLAHRAAGAAIRDLLDPDEVWYLVTPQNPDKPKDHMADFYHRLEMAKLNVCGLEKLVVTDIEKDITEKTKSMQSADTLRELIERYPDIQFGWVMGADVFLGLHTWDNYEYIMENVPIIVLPRAGYTEKIYTCPAAMHALCKELKTIEQLREQRGWHLLDKFPEDNISATAERERVNAGQRPDDRNVHPAVIDYIARNGLHF